MAVLLYMRGVDLAIVVSSQMAQLDAAPAARWVASAADLLVSAFGLAPGGVNGDGVAVHAEVEKISIASATLLSADAGSMPTTGMPPAQRVMARSAPQGGSAATVT